MSAFKSKVSDHSSDRAYILASKEKIDLSRLFDSPDLGKLLLHESIVKNTKVELILGALLPAISITLAPKTRLKLNEAGHEYTIRPNLYLISICVSGGGKSQAFHDYLIRPLGAIAASKTIPKLTCQQFTKSGLLESLEKNAGKLLWASDDCGSTMARCIGASDTEWKDFRPMLNDFYSGYGFSRATLSKSCKQIDSTFFSIAGFTHPQPFCQFLERAISANDGLEGRFMCITAAGYIDVTIESLHCADFVLQRARDWPTVALTYVYEQHVADQVVYVLDREAEEELRALRNMERQELIERFKEAERAVLYNEELGASFSLSYGGSSSSKDIDNGLRCCVLLHVAKYALLHALQQHKGVIPTVISKETFLRAFKLTAILKRQKSFYKTIALSSDEVNKVAPPALEEATRRGISHCNETKNPTTTPKLALEKNQNTAPKLVLEKNPNTIPKLVLEYPGPFVTAHMITRRKRDVTAAACVTTMIGMGSVPKTDVENFLGTYKELRIKGKPTHCIVKAKPDQIDERLLQKFNITRHSYTTMYNKDISDKAPNTGVAQNWSRYYRDVERAIVDARDSDDEIELY